MGEALGYLMEVPIKTLQQKHFFKDSQRFSLRKLSQKSREDQKKGHHFKTVSEFFYFRYKRLIMTEKAFRFWIPG